MPRRLLIPLLLSLAALLAAVAASAEVRQEGNLRITFTGDFSPHALPRDRPAPVTLEVAGAISTTDGSQAPPLRRIEIGLNDKGQISTAGLPACTASALQSTTTEAALERCRPALVGNGSFKANLDFPGLGQVPATGPILAFNGRHAGKPALFFHLFVATPARVTFVLPLTISRGGKGQFGTLLAGNIPTLAGGLGSVSDIKLKIGRNYTYKGQRRSYLSAACAAPAGFTGGSFLLARGSFRFDDGRTIVTTLSRNCRVR